MKSCLIVIPVYKPSIEGDELRSFLRCREVFMGKYDVGITVPLDLNVSFYEGLFPDIKVFRYPNHFFSSYWNYNRTCKSKELYEKFLSYDYILIYQLDSWIFDGNIDRFLEMGLDYIAAPVINARGWGDGIRVGCGGLSLRKTTPFYNASTSWNTTDNSFEDIYFSVNKAQELKIADARTATSFCLTSDRRDTLDYWFKYTGGKLPSFCHKFNSNDTWKFWGKYVTRGGNYKVSLISFANKDSGFSIERVSYEAEQMNYFHDVSLYTEDDFDSVYWEKNKSHFTDFPRGYGYWSWKPYFIKKKLSEMTDGDVLVYMDMGCTLIPQNKDTLVDWIFRSRYSVSGILSPCYGPYFERNWSKGDIFHFINTNYNRDGVDLYNNAVQCGTGVLVVTKNKNSVEFIDRWNDVMENHFELCTDLPSKYPNHPQFIENRHDQSVFSMLSKIYKIETIPTKDGILDKRNSPIVCTRCKNDKDTWKRPIHVVYDSQIFDLQKFGGISRVFVEVVKNTDNNEILENFTGSGCARGRYPSVRSTIAVVNTENENLLQSDLIHGNDHWNNSSEMLDDIINRGDFDIFVPTFYNYHFMNKIGSKPFVLFIPDMITELYPNYFPKNDLQNVGKRMMAPHAAAILVPTQTTKDDVVRILNVDANKVHVISHGIDENFGKNVNNVNQIGFPYILYVGHRAAYKGFYKFMRDIKPLLDEYQDLKILCTGPKFSEWELSFMRECGLAGKLAYCHPANDMQMAKLYKFAKAFIYTSEYEGFGIPTLEAYKMRCPVVLNGDNKCFREVAGDAAIFYSGNNPHDLRDKLSYVLGMNEMQRNSLLDLQSSRLRLYSWKKTADIVKGVYENICKI